MNTSKTAKIASIALALVALAWGTSYAIIKETLDIVEPLTLMAIRFGGAAILLSIVYANRLLKIKIHELKRGIIIGFFMFCAFATLSIGIQYTTASKQSFLIGAYVIIVPFLSWVINKIFPDKYAIIGAICAVVGLAMLTLGGIEGLTLGDGISILCSISFALHMIMIEKYCHDTDPIVLTIVQFWTAAIIFIVLAFTFENHDISVLTNATGSVAYLVIVTTVIAFVVQNVAQRYISSTSTALILTLESVFGSVFSMIYLGEKMSIVMILGCLIVFIGIVTQETKWSFFGNFTKG
jgi:drug/metabolite transporter (DMT)-like permease